MTRKEIAHDFLQLAAHGQSRKAFEMYVAENFKHHNAYFKGDRHSLMVPMEENAQKNPNKVFEIQRSLEDGDVVAVHSRVLLTQGNMELAVVHILKFEKDKIIEMWDLGQPVPAEKINENGVF